MPMVVVVEEEVREGHLMPKEVVTMHRPTIIILPLVLLLITTITSQQHPCYLPRTKPQFG